MILTEAAINGYNATALTQSPHYTTSPSDMAWQVGRWMQKTGRPAPRAVRTSRGYTMHVNDMLVKITYAKSGVSIERLR